MHPETITTRYGFRIKVDLDDWLGQYVFATGDFEPSTSVAIASLLARGDAVLDVGANIGFLSLLMAKRVGPAGRVFCFEPIPELLTQIEENAALNGFENVVACPYAAWDHAGMRELHKGAPTHLGKSSLRKISSASEAIQVETLPLDDFDLGVQQISLVKIDVEGAECAVLRGMQGILQRDRPDVVVEVTDGFLKELGDSGEVLFAMLQSLGYRTYVIDYDGLRELAGWSEDLRPQFNVLATCRPSLPTSLDVIQSETQSRQSPPAI